MTKLMLSIAILFIVLPVVSQKVKSLNTAENCDYMKEIEKEMIYEVNLVRNQPIKYSEFVTEYFNSQIEMWGEHWDKESYSPRIHYDDNNNNISQVDTFWFNLYEIKLEAYNSLIQDLKNLEKLSILYPDSGIYLATIEFSHDNDTNNWELYHLGSDGSWPYDRIAKNSPEMQTGGENIACYYGGFKAQMNRYIQNFGKHK